MIDKKEILNNIPDKKENTWTTSLKFKEDFFYVTELKSL